MPFVLSLGTTKESLAPSFLTNPRWVFLDREIHTRSFLQAEESQLFQRLCTIDAQLPAWVYSSRAQGNPDREVPIPAHPQRYHFSCCLSSHLLLLQQIAKDRTVLGLDPGYGLSLRAWSARLHRDLQCSLPPCSCGKVALANMSLRHSWHLAWLLDCLQYSLQPALQSLLLPSFAGRLP